ncbi:hypothetical protein GUITHDRAFT_137739 [Guillardia theta CCMP2712]|uniref:SAP domain-containing protein n=1 Tax=Guillardia theta (strain CCMP2712) TaxID=905079 RepID=L1JGB5_GUITC|nr:hypothetical protein GUITHDRAFT_137739 [Guillardia theta CCMP2712]EKX47140.1 hypothetical protein GUITHDRAFT_137739 [Guillardia theta CCMP2712]|eukprot:XP_005834120.1 hypothetical protein GUITHDRAFT_137739 [Guillardia theta CCMP2712]
MVATLGAATLICSWSFPLPPSHLPLSLSSSSHLSAPLSRSSLVAARYPVSLSRLSAPQSYLLTPVQLSSADHHSTGILSLRSRVDGPLSSGAFGDQSSSKSHGSFLRQRSVRRIGVQVRSGGPYVGEKMGENEILFDEEDLKRMKVPDLKELCGKYGLLKTGKKQELIDRLMEYQMELMDSDGDGPMANVGNDDDEDAETFYSSVGEGGGEQENVLMGEEEIMAQQRSNIARATGMIVKTMGKLEEGSERFITQTRTGNCWHGLFFEIEAKSKGVTITSINTASSPEHFGPIREDKMNVWFYTCEGSCKDKELDPSAWTMIGQVTDEDDHIRLRAGYLPKNDASYEDTMFMEVYEPKMANAFVGAIEHFIQYKVAD